MMGTRVGYGVLVGCAIARIDGTGVMIGDAVGNGLTHAARNMTTSARLSLVLIYGFLFGMKNLL